MDIAYHHLETLKKEMIKRIERQTCQEREEHLLAEDSANYADVETKW